MTVRSSGGSDWSVLGYEFEDPETGELVVEGDGDPGVPVFQGIGIYARPVGDNGEGMILHVGGEADHPTVGAVRDEDGRKAYVAAFEEPGAGEVAIYNGQGTARILIKADGSISVKGLSATVDAPDVKLGGEIAIDSLIKGTLFGTSIMTPWTVATAAMVTALAAVPAPEIATIPATHAALTAYFAALSPLLATFATTLSAKVKTE